jgi:hypothetical protein
MNTCISALYVLTVIDCFIHQNTYMHTHTHTFKGTRGGAEKRGLFYTSEYIHAYIHAYI